MHFALGLGLHVHVPPFGDSFLCIFDAPLTRAAHTHAHTTLTRTRRTVVFSQGPL